jgi:hypothetical protein
MRRSNEKFHALSQQKVVTPVLSMMRDMVVRTRSQGVQIRGGFEEEQGEGREIK